MMSRISMICRAHRRDTRSVSERLTTLCSQTISRPASAHILMMKACQDLDFSEGALTVGLMFKRADLLYCNLGHSLVVES